MNVRIHAFEAVSRANGPGRRTVVWFQGCSLGCPECFNPETHAGGDGESVDAGELALRVLRAGSRVEGVTFSGGEPFQQPSGLLEILAALASSSLTMLCFSGYTLGEIRRLPLGPAILDHLDVLVAGRYAASRPAGGPLLGSSNQRVHLLTDRYDRADIARVPPRELILHADGSVTVSGVAPWRWKEKGSRPLSPEPCALPRQVL